MLPIMRQVLEQRAASSLESYSSEKHARVRDNIMSEIVEKIPVVGDIVGKKAVKTAPKAGSKESVLVEMKTVGGKFRYFITVKIGQTKQRKIIAEGRANLADDSFRAIGLRYQVDSEKVFLMAKEPIIIYDKFTFEPLDPETHPELKDLEAHFSKKADDILTEGFVQQTVRTIKETPQNAGLPMNWLVILIIGCAVGFFAG